MHTTGSNCAFVISNEPKIKKEHVRLTQVPLKPFLKICHFKEKPQFQIKIKYNKISKRETQGTSFNILDRS